MRTYVLTAAVLLAALAGTVYGTVGGGTKRFMVSGAAAVVFSHDQHVTEKKMKCTECHYRLYNQSGVHKNVTMAEMQQGKSCGACHNGQRAFDVKGSCAKCHTG